jgi:hypothetical protein
MVSLSFLVGASSLSIAAGVRVRREIRTLTDKQRDDVFAALNIMKSVSQEEGEILYGSHFLNYDRMVLKHMRAALHPRCDMGHNGPAFLTFHRALELAIENSLISVDPSIEGLPYWGYNKDFASGKPRESEVWKDHFFGSTYGDAENENMIQDGFGKDWEINANARELFAKYPVDARSIDQSADVVNSFNFLRGPTNLQSAPRVTRSSTTCGVPNEELDGIVTKKNFSICLSTPPENSGVMPFFECIDAGMEGPHSFYHPWLGGAWGGDADASICAEKQRGLSLSDVITGCMKCPEHCTAGEECTCHRDEEVCTQTNLSGSCVHWPMQPDGDCMTCDNCKDGILGAVGDAWDTASSPNDPSFVFHHVNVDRLWMEWQQRWAGISSSGYPYSGFPSTGMCLGHNLADVISERDPFEGFLLLQNHSDVITNAKLLEATVPNENVLYTYDTLLGEQPLTIPMSRDVGLVVSV